MKNLLMTVLMTMASFSSFAASQQISQRVVNLPVDVSKAKVKFTNLGYGQTSFVKIIVPELAEFTLANHRNEGEDGPCLATYQTYNLEDVAEENPRQIPTDFVITLTKSQFVNSENICKVSLREDIRASVKGFLFVHQRVIQLPDRVAADCI